MSAYQVKVGDKVLVSTETWEMKTGRGQAIAHSTSKDQNRLRLLLDENARPFSVQSNVVSIRSYSVVLCTHISFAEWWSSFVTPVLVGRSGGVW